MLGKTVAGVNGVLLALLEINPQCSREWDREAGAISPAIYKHPYRELRILRPSQLDFDRWMEGTTVP